MQNLDLHRNKAVSSIFGAQLLLAITEFVSLEAHRRRESRVCYPERVAIGRWRIGTWSFGVSLVSGCLVAFLVALGRWAEYETYYAPGRAAVEALYIGKAWLYFVYLPAMLLGLVLIVASLVAGMLAVMRRSDDARLAALGVAFSSFILLFFSFAFLRT